MIACIMTKLERAKELKAVAESESRKYRASAEAYRRDKFRDIAKDHDRQADSHDLEVEMYNDLIALYERLGGGKFVYGDRVSLRTKINKTDAEHYAGYGVRPGDSGTVLAQEKNGNVLVQIDRPGESVPLSAINGDLHGNPCAGVLWFEAGDLVRNQKVKKGKMS